MGTVPQPETKRDLALIKDYNTKTKTGKEKDEWVWTYSISQLGLRYARIESDKLIPLTDSRIHQILNKHGVKKHRHFHDVEILDKS